MSDISSSTNETLSDPKLYQALGNFNFDSGDPILSFAERLARENNWSLSYAQAVIQEYRRFLYLACVAGHPVTPSDEVDQAWHLHLAYTQSYWEDLCKQTLGKPLHHNPTEGGSSESKKFYQWYETTLKSYQEEFGFPAPQALWPAPEQRFDPIYESQRIRLVNYRMIPYVYIKRAWLLTNIILVGFMYWWTNSLFAVLIPLLLLNISIRPLITGKDCPRCHRFYAMTSTHITHPVQGWKQIQCKHCHYTEWLKRKKSHNNGCAGGCGGNGCAGCGGGGCGGGCGG